MTHTSTLCQAWLRMRWQAQNMGEPPYPEVLPMIVMGRDVVPMQRNGSDCGVFVCRMAECLAQGVRMEFTQLDMPYFRRLTVLELRQGSLARTPCKGEDTTTLY